MKIEFEQYEIKRSLSLSRVEQQKYFSKSIEEKGNHR